MLTFKTCIHLKNGMPGLTREYVGFCPAPLATHLNPPVGTIFLFYVEGPEGREWWWIDNQGGGHKSLRQYYKDIGRGDVTFRVFKSAHAS